MATSLRLVPDIHRATHRIGIYLAGLGRLGLSQGEAHILAHLASGRPATIAELHRALAHKRSTLTSILDRLVERGLVVREVSPADRRSFVVTTTRRGRQAARRVHRHLEDLERAVLAEVGEADRRGFETVIAAVEREARQRTRPRQSGVTARRENRGPRRAIS